LPLPDVGDLQRTEREPDLSGSYPSSYEDGGVDKRSIREYLHIVYKRLPLILALTILTTAAAAFYMYRQASMYSASSSMIIEPRRPKATQTVNINFGNDYKYYNTQLKLLQNRELMYDVVVLHGLYKNPNLLQGQGGNRGLFSTLRSMFSGPKAEIGKNESLAVLSNENADADDEEISLTPEEKRRAEMYSSRLVGGISVSQVKTTNLVNITVRNRNPALAATLANGMATVFMKQDSERETQGSREVLEDLEKSIKELRGTIAKEENELITLMKNSGLAISASAGGTGGEIVIGRLGTLSGQWLGAMDERRRIEAKYDTVLQTKKPSILPEGFNTEAIKNIREQRRTRIADLENSLRGIDKQISDLETTYRELKVRYTDEWVKVKEVVAKIEERKEFRKKTESEYKNKINEDTSKDEKGAFDEVLAGLRAQLNAAQKRETKLRNEYWNEGSSSNVQGQVSRRMTTARRELQTKRGLLDTYVKRQAEHELTLSSSVPDNIKISSRAVVPTTPIGPDRNRNILVAFLVSLIGGIGLAFLLDYLDDSIRTSDDISRNLGLPTLALIPHQDAISKRQLRDSTNDSGDGDVHSLALIALQNTRSAIAEAYRHLRTSLLFSSAGNPPQTILITSSQPAEGKTTTAVNTAITLAQSEVDVVLIDCDLRRPRIQGHFDLSNSHGLTNYLSGEKNTENLLKPCAELPNLKIITSGPIPPNPAELLSSNEMKNLLHFLKGNYKHVILDSPPAISFTDSAILATLVDGVVIVAMAGTSSIHLMKRFKQRLAGLGTRIYGVVLNGVKPNSLEYGYYGYNYSYDYYANSDEITPLLDDDAEMLLESEEEEEESVHETKG